MGRGPGDGAKCDDESPILYCNYHNILRTGCKAPVAGGPALLLGAGCLGGSGQRLRRSGIRG